MNDQFDEAIGFYNEAVEYFQGLEFDKAISSASQAIELFSDLAPAYSIRGNAYYGKKDYKKSIEDQTNAIRLTEKKEEELQLEKSLSDIDKINEVLNDFKKSKAAIYFYRGNAYDDSGDSVNAEKDFSESIRLNPAFANVYNSRGVVYLKNGDYISAIDDFTRAIENKYEIISFAYNNRAEALHHLERYEEAISDCHAAIENDPAYANAYNTCGFIYALIDDIDNAWLYYKRALAVNPNHSAAQINLQHLGKQKPRIYTSSTSVSLRSDTEIDFYGVE